MKNCSEWIISVFQHFNFAGTYDKIFYKQESVDAHVWNLWKAGSHFSDDKQILNQAL